MAELIALVVVLVALGLLTWWKSSAPEDPQENLARKFRESGGWGPMGGGL